MSKPGRLYRLASHFCAIAMPTLVATPCPSGPVVVSTPETQWYSGCPGALLSSWRKRRISSSVTEGWPRFSYSPFTACVFVRWSTDQSSIEAWPFESTNRSRLGQIGSFGSKRMTRFQSVYTSGASAIGVPGCPDFACWTASMERVRMVLIANCIIFSSVIVFSSRFFLRFACLYGSDFAQAPQVSLGLAECGGQECLDEVPGDGWPYGPASYTQDVQVIVLDPLLGSEVVVDARRADALHLVGTH